ncbi:hypothetical protein [Mucilaginibacter psychrotolerans]|nr:hypothetical protein [Mucilaginibacter psychrotolerans]
MSEEVMIFISRGVVVCTAPTRVCNGKNGTWSAATFGNISTDGW